MRRALAGVESRELLGHPEFVAGAGGTLIILVVAGLVGADFSALALSGLACLPLAVGTFVATHLAARRDSRAGIEELLATLPQPARSRTMAQLVAVAATAAVAVAAVGAVGAVGAMTIAVVALGGPEVRFASGVERRIPSFPELAQGPLAVAVLGLAGVAVGRLVRTGLLAPVLAVVLLVSMWPEGGLRWFAPVANPPSPFPAATGRARRSPPAPT